MRLFDFIMNTRIIAGSNAILRLPSLIKERWRIEKILLVSDKGILQAGLIDKVFAVLGDFRVVIYDSVPQDSSLDVVNEVSEIYRRENCQLVIALGGGSVIDTAKGVCVVVDSNRKIQELQGVDVIQERRVPFVVIPTTCGTGSEVTKFAVIEDRSAKRKLAFTSSSLIADLVILDPTFVENMPLPLMAQTTMDSLTHAVEAYTSINKNPVTDTFSLVAIKLIFLNIKDACEGKREARFNLLVASTLSGVAFSNSMVGMVHAIAHALGGVSGVPHGLANAIILPYVIKFNMKRSENAIKLYEDITKYLKLFMDIKEKDFFEILNSLLTYLNRKANLPLRLRDVGVKKEDLEKIAKASLLDGSSLFNIVSFDEKDVVDLLLEAF